MDATTAPSVELRCPRCGRMNRVLRARLGQGPVCGACHATLVASSPVAVTDATWAAEVERSPLPVLVDFWAPWCGPCRAIAPVLDQLAGEYGGRVKVAKLNVDENPGTAARFAVQAIPTMILFSGGRVVEQVRGAVPRATLQALLARVATPPS
jgi:thioredoxin 2